MKIKSLRLFVVILLLLVSLCSMSSCSSGTPSVSEMEQDYIGNGIMLTIENPFTEEEEIEYFEITSFECEKTQTTEWGFDAYCFVSFSNEYYDFTKNVTMHYTKYDGNVYEYNGVEETICSYLVKTNPFSEEDCTHYCEAHSSWYEDLKSCSFEFKENLNEVHISFITEREYPNVTFNYDRIHVYFFNGEKWEAQHYQHLESKYEQINKWDFVGTWIGEEKVKQVVIEDFDLYTKTISGYAKIENVTFDLGKAEVKTDWANEEDEDGAMIGFEIYDPYYISIWITVDRVLLIKGDDATHTIYSDWWEDLERA